MISWAVTIALAMTLTMVTSGHGQDSLADRRAPLDSVARATTLAEIQSTLDELVGVAQETRDDLRQDTFLKRMGEGYLGNVLWEFFGLKKSGKNLFGLLFSALGLLLAVIRLGVELTKKGEPRILRLAITAYLVIAMMALFTLTLTGPTGQEAHGRQGGTRLLAEQMSSLEANLDRQLQALDGRIGSVRIDGGWPRRAGFPSGPARGAPRRRQSREPPRQYRFPRRESWRPGPCAPR